MTVLDASAILALLHDEPGADEVAARVEGGLLGTATLADVVGKLIDADIDVARLRPLLAAAGVTIEPVLEQDGELCRCAALACRRPLVVGQGRERRGRASSCSSTSAR